MKFSLKLNQTFTALLGTLTASLLISGCLGTESPVSAVKYADQVPIRVKNNCGYPLKFRVSGNGTGGGEQQANQGEQKDFVVSGNYGAARVTAFRDNEEVEKIEFNLEGNGARVQYNVTYVDWVGLPVEVKTSGGGGCVATGCYAKAGDILNGCPGELRQGNKCLAPRTFCQGKSGGICGVLPYDAYSCQGAAFGFPAKNRECAAANRGVGLDQVENAGAFYKGGNYNQYAKWVHEKCGNVYAFPSDDVGGQASGLKTCTDPREMIVTFCPAG